MNCNNDVMEVCLVSFEEQSLQRGGEEVMVFDIISDGRERRDGKEMFGCAGGVFGG
jgi:hypothetical protein